MRALPGWRCRREVWPLITDFPCDNSPMIEELKSVKKIGSCDPFFGGYFSNQSSRNFRKFLKLFVSYGRKQNPHPWFFWGELSYFSERSSQHFRQFRKLFVFFRKKPPPPLVCYLFLIFIYFFVCGGGVRFLHSQTRRCCRHRVRTPPWRAPIFGVFFFHKIRKHRTGVK